MTAQKTTSQHRTVTISHVETGSEPDALSLDEVFDLLSNQRRRFIIRYLLSEDEPSTLGDLAEMIASIENDKPIQMLSSSERKRVYICLYQAHLPKLDDANVIDFDKDRKTIERGENIEAVAEFLPKRDPQGTNDNGARWTTVVSDFVAGISNRLPGDPS